MLQVYLLIKYLLDVQLIIYSAKNLIAFLRKSVVEIGTTSKAAAKWRNNLRKLKLLLKIYLGKFKGQGRQSGRKDAPDADTSASSNRIAGVAS